MPDLSALPPLLLLAFVVCGAGVAALLVLFWIWPMRPGPPVEPVTQMMRPRPTRSPDRLGLGLDWLGEDPPEWRW